MENLGCIECVFFSFSYLCIFAKWSQLATSILVQTQVVAISTEYFKRQLTFTNASVEAFPTWRAEFHYDPEKHWKNNWCLRKHGILLAKGCSHRFTAKLAGATSGLGPTPSLQRLCFDRAGSDNDRGKRNSTLSSFFPSDPPLSQQSVLLKCKDTGNKTHCSHSLYDHIMQNLPGQPALPSDLWEPPPALFLWCR